MALTSAKRASLEKKQKEGIKQGKGTLQYQGSLELSVQSEPATGLLKYIRKSKGGSFVYGFTGDKGHFFVYSNEKLEVDEVENHSFRLSTTPDGKQFTWFE